MNLFDPFASPALLAAVLLLLTLVGLRQRQRQGKSPRRSGPARDGLDTVQAWPPESARVMSIHERQAHDLLRRALPGFLVLAQVPLSRFLRVPMRHSYADWMQRVGSLGADLLLCDSASRVLAVIDVRAGQETERSRRRHERLARVLKAADIRVFVWREGELPSLSEVRNGIGAQLAEAMEAGSTASRPTPATTASGIDDMLAAGDQLAYDAAMEPVPSGFFEEMESTRGQLARS